MSRKHATDGRGVVSWRVNPASAATFGLERAETTVANGHPRAMRTASDLGSWKVAPCLIIHYHFLSSRLLRQALSGAL